MRYLMLLSFVLGGLSCDDHDHDERPAECKAIIEACHGPDKGSGDIHECHESAETTWTKDQCVSNSARCLGLCRAPTDGSAHD